MNTARSGQTSANEVLGHHAVISHDLIVQCQSLKTSRTCRPDVVRVPFPTNSHQQVQALNPPSNFHPQEMLGVWDGWTSGYRRWKRRVVEYASSMFQMFLINEALLGSILMRSM